MTPGGIVMAFAAIFMSMIMDHGQPASLIKIPALLLVFGGTVGATIAGGLKKDVGVLPKAMMVAMKPKKHYNAAQFTEHLMDLARSARTGGLKVLERELPEAQDDPFTRTGVELITTTSDPERVRMVLDAEIHGIRQRHRVGYKAFQDMAGYAPTIGILGTVIGLVHVLGSLTSPGTLGPAIASAFTATLWGVLTANVMWLPISNKLKRLSEEEIAYKELVIEGLLAVQEGISGPQLKDRLVPFLPPKERPEDRAVRERGVSTPLPRNHKSLEHEEHAGGMERWLLTYSDMITLLLVLFIVLYALSSLNHVKYAEFEHGLNASFNNGHAQPSSARTQPSPGKPGSHKVQLYASAAQIELQLIKALKSAGVLGAVKITRTSQGVVEGLVTGKTFYSIDSAALTPLGESVIDVSATVLRRYANTDDVEGYTDNEPIVGGPYINNWQLSADRAVYVVTRLQDVGHVDPSQMIVAGFGQYHPIVPNNTPANQAQNRRVNIVITNPPGSVSPAQVATPGSSPASSTGTGAAGAGAARRTSTK